MYHRHKHIAALLHIVAVVRERGEGKGGPVRMCRTEFTCDAVVNDRAATRADVTADHASSTFNESEPRHSQPLSITIIDQWRINRRARNARFYKARWIYARTRARNPLFNIGLGFTKRCVFLICSAFLSSPFSSFPFPSYQANMARHARSLRGDL